MADKPNTNIEVTEAQRQTILNALTEKLIDIESYLRTSKVPKKPSAEDACCDFHLQRFEVRRDNYEALRQQHKHVGATIELFTFAEAR